jgi:opacity protein-like surface antigen
MNKRMTYRILVTLTLMLVFAPAASAQEHEVAFLVGRMDPSDRGLQIVSPAKAVLGGATTYQVNYANRIVDGDLASVHWEIAITGSPSTKIEASNALLPRSYRTLFLTPGLKLKLFPGGGISPYVVGGAGVGRYTQSQTNSDGSPNTGDRSNFTWVFDYGGGLDFNLLGPVSLRAELRDFVTGNPDFRAPFLNNRQHNLFFAGGIVVKWR